MVYIIQRSFSWRIQIHNSKRWYLCISAQKHECFKPSSGLMQKIFRRKSFLNYEKRRIMNSNECKLHFLFNKNLKKYVIIQVQKNGWNSVAGAGGYHKWERTDAASASLSTLTHGIKIPQLSLFWAWKKLVLCKLSLRTRQCFLQNFFCPWKHEKTELKSCS